MNKILRIRLKSDLCAGSGESLGSLIDSDICFDNLGFAYIPAKRIKGLLKEAVEEIYDWEQAENEKEKIKNICSKMFGVEDDIQSCNLKIDNAYLENIEKIQNDILNIEDRYKKYVGKHRIQNANTYVRYQTAIDNETGVAKDNSLRSIRVLEAGNVFEARIEIQNDEEYELLKKCAKLVTHMGSNRTRGLGEVIVEIIDAKNEEDSNQNQYPFEDEKEYKIKLLLKADSNIMISKQNSESSVDFIPGANLMGAVASKYIKENNISDFNNLSEEYINLFLDGSVKYSNSYITDKNGKVEYYPAPLSYTKVKNESNKYHNKMMDVNETNIQLSNLESKYVSLDENNYVKEVSQAEHYHHQRAKDNSIGHVSTEKDGGAFYQFVSIDMGQYFLGSIETKGKYAKKIIKYINENEILRVGKSKTAEYGKLVIKNTEIMESKTKENTCKKFAIVLTSPVILYSKDKYQYANDKESLISEIQSVLGNNNLKVTKSFIGYSEESGYNALWNLPKEQLVSYSFGSTICFESNEPINVNDEYTIGVRKNEGYGKVKFYNLDSKTTSNLELKKYEEKLNEKIEYKNLSKETKKVVNKCIRNVLKEEILQNALDTVEKNINQIDLNNTTIGRILLMKKESKSFEEFITNVKSIKDNKKLNKVISILENKENVFELQAYKDYENIFNITGNKIQEKEKEDYIMEYIKQFFNILKIEGGRK